MVTVLVVGETLIDIVRRDGTESRHPGGSPMNVAYGLAQLDVPVQLLTRIGRDDELVTSHLAGVELLPASLRDSPTSTAIATIAADGSASYDFDITWDLAPFEADVDWAHVGSIGAFLSPGAEAVEQFLRATTARVSFDPNIRPALMPADAVQRFERIAALTDVLKLSDEDGRWLYPTLDEKALLDHLQGLGPQTVALTRGANGAVIAGSERFEIAAVPVEVADTVGAGDTFMAALIAELLDNKPVDAAARTAIAAAAITVSRVGAQLPTRAEITALFK